MSEEGIHYGKDVAKVFNALRAENERLRGEVERLSYRESNLVNTNCNSCNRLHKDNVWCKQQLAAQSALLAECRGMLEKIHPLICIVGGQITIQAITNKCISENCELAALIEKLKAK